ncbi:MAG TPA: hypothetical protein VJ719_10825 [Chthoniobacterales bacterium]|nr:hypothetical protein [Chthoniobacterales bacterium]
MNSSLRCLILLVAAALCAGGWVSVARDDLDGALGLSASAAGELESDYKFASIDLHRLSFAQLEEVVRADAATRFPNTRVELGSVKGERGGLSMTVVVFGPNRQSQAVLYALVPNKDSWKILSARRLRFVPPSQIGRGLRI